MDIFEKCTNFTRVNEAREKGIYPYFHALESRQDIVVTMEGKRRIMLGSNNYLGLTVAPQVIEAGIKAIEKYGSGCSGSRFLNGTLNMHLELEHELADFLRKPATMVFSTGFQANLGIISAIVGMGDYVICDKENHASIYDACRLSLGKMVRYRHSDMDDLRRKLEEIPEKAGKLIVTDGVFSMGGDIALLPEICALAREYGARVMVDDAHGLGVLGEGGRGTASYFGLEDQVDIYMGTFSKSLASLGGYMAADEVVVDYVKHTSRPFIFSASIPPANCACAMAALRILRSQPELVTQLGENGRHMRQGLKARGVKIRMSETPIIPLFTTDADTTLVVGNELFREGVYVNPVLPPATPPQDCLLRTSLMASHTVEVMDEAIEIIARVFQKYGLTES